MNTFLQKQKSQIFDISSLKLGAKAEEFILMLSECLYHALLANFYLSFLLITALLTSSTLHFLEFHHNKSLSVGRKQKEIGLHLRKLFTAHYDSLWSINSTYSSNRSEGLKLDSRRKRFRQAQRADNTLLSLREDTIMVLLPSRTTLKSLCTEPLLRGRSGNWCLWLSSLSMQLDWTVCGLEDL